MTISLAFLAPDLVRAAIEGRLPHGMGVTRLADLPAEWPASTKWLAFQVNNHAVEPGLFEPQSLFAGKRNIEGRDEEAEAASNAQGRPCRDQISLEPISKFPTAVDPL